MPRQISLFSFKAFLSLILVSLTTVDANSLSHRGTSGITLPLATRINNKSDALKLVERDQARAKYFQSRDQQTNGSPSFSDTNSVVVYTAQVGIGNPAHNYTLVIDTGSSNTWVGVSKPYIPTSSSNNTGNTVTVVYGGAYFFGEEWTDTVILSPDLVIEKQSIGAANQSNGIPYDGILGIGPVDLTDNTVTHMSAVPTISDSLLSQGKISKEVVGIYCVPVSEPTSNGTITFGGYDPSVITDSVKYVSLTSTSPSSRSWGIDQSVHYGDTTILSTNAGIVDTGTTLILIASDAFQKYQSATGATFDYHTNLLAITSIQYSSLKTLSFSIGGTSYGLSPNAQIWPRSLNTAIGGNSSAIYLIINDTGSASGSGLDFIMGLAFLEHYYSVFDTTNKRVGFASTAHTKADTN